MVRPAGLPGLQRGWEQEEGGRGDAEQVSGWEGQVEQTMPTFPISATHQPDTRVLSLTSVRGLSTRSHGR